MHKYHRSHWDTLVKRYAIGRRSDLDMSLAVADLIRKLRHDFPDVEVGCDVEANLCRPPMKYVYVCNKTVGPVNIPDEPHRFTALTECELTFYQNHDNTVRFRYFIQLTHGQLIHGVSWVKASTEIPFRSKDFDEARHYVTDNFLKTESDPDILIAKDSYGIYDGSGHRIGVMHNHAARGFGDSHCIMCDAVMAKMLYLINQAFAFFKENKESIKNIIDNQQSHQ